MKKENVSVSKTIKAELTADEVRQALVIKAGGRNSYNSSVKLLEDGGAIVEYSVKKG